MGLFSSNINSYIGIDIGTSSIKMVELEKRKNGIELLGYGFSENVKENAEESWTKKTDYVVRMIDKIYKEMGGSSTNAIATLPAFSVFSSIISLNNVDKKELASAVEWEAKKVIPLPLEEMVLDWKVVGDSKKQNKNIKIFLTGSPKKLIKKYVDIFSKTQINLLKLETETFSLVRSLLGDDKSTVMIVEVGANNTGISIVKDSIPMINRSIDMGGKVITKTISNNLNISMHRAEQFKKDLGIVSSRSDSDVIPKTIANSIGPIVNEIKYLIDLFQNKNDEKVEKVILSGGSVMLPNMVEYLSKILNINVIIGDPWARVVYADELKPILTEIGPSFSIAIGSAMREIK